MKNVYADTFSMLQSLLGVKNVYNLTPMKEVPYPFAVLGDENNEMETTQDAYLMSYGVSFDLWFINRVDLQNTIEEVKNRLFEMDAYDINYTIIKDTSTDALLWHGVVDFKIKE